MSTIIMISSFRKSCVRTLVYSALLLLLVGISAGWPPQKSSATPNGMTADLQRRFQAAVAAYNSQQYSEAQRILEPLLEHHSNSFELNELAGLIYVARGQYGKANPYLMKAVHLNSKVAPAATTLAANLVQLHRNNEAEAQFLHVVKLEPHNFEANHNLGEFYIQAGKLGKAIPYLKRAQELNPTVYNNGYDLALAYEQSGDLEQARKQIQQLIKVNDTAELHSLLGEVEEKYKNYLAAATQYERAARMDPSESNILDWGVELMLHQTFEPAVEIFNAGRERFPNSSKLQTALGIALNGLGRFDEGAKALMKAGERDLSNPLPLILLGKDYENLSPAIADEVRSRLKQSIKTNQNNASLRYYYAMSLWKQRQDHPDGAGAAQEEIESLLKTAVSIDPRSSEAYLQLGILYATQRRFDDAIRQYKEALAINSENATIHYRLGQAFARTGESDRAQQEFAEFERLHKLELAETNKQSAQIQQFVYSMHTANDGRE